MNAFPTSLDGWCSRGCGRPARRTISNRTDVPRLCRECYLGAERPEARTPIPVGRPKQASDIPSKEIERLYQRAKRQQREERLRGLREQAERGEDRWHERI